MSKETWERLKLSERSDMEMRDMLAYLSGYAPEAVDKAVRLVDGER